MSTFQAPQLLSCAYRSAYVFKLRYNIKRYAFNPITSYAYVSRYAATFTFQDMLTLQKILFCSKLRSYAYIHSKIRLGYAILSKGTLSIPSQAMLTFQDLQLRLRFKIRSHKDAFESLKISFPKIKKLSLWITQGPPVICLAENTVQNFFTIQKFSWALGISLQHFKFN